jgi:acyl-CoA synthetase (AMP-forming)/AMP-acid ligase II
VQNGDEVVVRIAESRSISLLLWPVQAYGLTEYSCVTISHCDAGNGRGPSKPGSVGFLLPGLELKFRDPNTGLCLPANTPGEICVRGESTMKGPPLLPPKQSL